MKIDQYCQRQRCKHVELEQFWHAFASRGFVSDSWAFLFYDRMIWLGDLLVINSATCLRVCVYVLADWRWHGVSASCSRWKPRQSPRISQQQRRYRRLQCCKLQFSARSWRTRLFHSFLWRPLLPYGYCYKASYARPGWAVICNFWHPASPERQCARMSKSQLNRVWYRMLYSCVSNSKGYID